MQNKIGRNFEKRWAKKSSSKVTIGSGNLWFDKEDCKNSNWLFQTKATKKDVYSLNLNDIVKLKQNAKKTKRDWAFVIEFQAEHVIHSTCFVILPLRTLVLSPKTCVKYSVDMVKKPVNKQISLKREALDDSWLEDRLFAFKFRDNQEVLVAVQEVDFLRIFEKSLF